jgi:hypothetical protein
VGWAIVLRRFAPTLLSPRGTSREVQSQPSRQRRDKHFRMHAPLLAVEYCPLSMAEKRRPTGLIDSLLAQRRRDPSLDALRRLLEPSKHRVFVSYHHKDEFYRAEFDRIAADVAINVSVSAGEIDDDNSTNYIKRLIQLDYITNASVVVVLIGPRTYCRKHIDWEIAAGLNKKVGDYSGLLGICLPNRTDFGAGNPLDVDSTPPRLVDNLRSGYAQAYDWTADVPTIGKWIATAFAARVEKAALIDNSRLQFARNLCD